MVCRVAPLELIRLLSDSVMSLQVAKDDSCVNHNNNRINNAVLLLLPLSELKEKLNSVASAIAEKKFHKFCSIRLKAKNGDAIGAEHIARNNIQQVEVSDLVSVAHKHRALHTFLKYFKSHTNRISIGVASDMSSETEMEQSWRRGYSTSNTCEICCAPTLLSSMH